MAVLLSQTPAPGAPGSEPKWTRSDKHGVGTAYSALSRIWFTISKGVVNEVYYPTIDRPQIRDLQFVVTDGDSFVHDERQMDNTHEYLAPGTLGFCIVNADPGGRYRLIKEVIADPHQDCLLLHTRLEADPALLPKLRLYALLAPHLGVGGRGNSGHVARTDWGDVLTANKDGTWVVMAPSTPFLGCSCGYVGVSDGWQDLMRHRRMAWRYDSAVGGNIALIGELDLRKASEFVLALAFSDSLHHGLVTVAQALGTGFPAKRQRFLEQWQKPARHVLPALAAATGDGGRLLQTSHSLILAHEDKTYDGALIASLSIPWGEFSTDKDLGGYHLVWTRDMVNSATGLLAAGSTEAPLRALIYLACTQKEDGGFFQNFWINGEPYWRNVQLDETAFPIILAWRLHQAGGLQNFDPYPMVLKAARFLVQEGPVTPQERWEEASGYSPSTLAAQIAALVCAAAFARTRAQGGLAQYLEDYADFLEAHVDAWTVTTTGRLVAGIPRHFIRIHPADAGAEQPDEVADHGRLELRNQPPGARTSYAARDIVDGGFLELVRYGIRKAGEPLMEDSLRVIDAVLRVVTPAGLCWRRYNHDGYGQDVAGGPFLGSGYGHAWPLLSGERGHYELAAGRDVRPYLRTLEALATETLLLPEQVWALPDLPAAHMALGRPTGGAMPLVWAHAEYLKLVRSAADGAVFDLIPEVARRYRDRPAARPLELWKFNRQVRAVPAGAVLRVQASAPFRLRWTADDWRQAHDAESAPVGFGAGGPAFVDLAVGAGQQAPLRFTFQWTTDGRWEGRDFSVGIGGPGAAGGPPAEPAAAAHAARPEAPPRTAT